MEVQILSQKFIKPSIPTPHHRRNMKISFLDQVAPRQYVPMILYYSADANLTISNVDERYQQLERSLSETLSLYYPLAGRYIEDRHTVDCNDEGALYLEAKVNGQLAQLLQGETDAKLLNCLVPIENEMEFSPIVLAIQINKFECGGLAIGMCISHKVADGVTASLFLNAWATSCRAGINAVISPNFDAGYLFPAIDTLRFGSPPRHDVSKFVTKRFVFSGDAISTLKAKVMAYACDWDVKVPPSRVEVVTSIIWKALIVVAQEKYGRLRPSLLNIPMNFRGKSVISVKENSCGNIYRLVNAQFEGKGSKVELHDLVSLLGDAIKKANEECAKVVNSDDVLAMVSNSWRELYAVKKNSDADICFVPIWCRLPFYEVDFGWRKPTWYSTVHKPSEKVVLVDTKCGTGIEAWVCLEEQNMLKFQQDQDIMAFTSKLEQHH